MPERPDVEGYSAMPEGRSGANYAPSGDAPHLRRQTVFTPKVKPKVEPKGDGWINKGISYLKDKQKNSFD